MFSLATSIYHRVESSFFSFSLKGGGTYFWSGATKNHALVPTRKSAQACRNFFKQLMFGVDWSDGKGRIEFHTVCSQS